MKSVILRGGIMTGMSPDDVIGSWGQPVDKYSNDYETIWTYYHSDKKTELYFRDGELKDWKDFK